MDIAIPEGTVNALKRTGITEDQLKIYILLLKGGPKTVSEISNDLRKDRAAVYKHIERITKLGLVDKGLSDANVYIARPIEKFREIASEALEEQYVKERAAINSMIKELESISGSYERYFRSEYTMIFGRKRLYQELRKLFMETHSEYRLIMSGNGLLRSIRHGLLNDYVEMLRRGVKVMVISEVNEQNAREASMLYQYMPFKHQSGLQIRLNIFDQDRVLLGAIQHDEDFSINRRDDSYLLIYDRRLATGFIRLFDAILASSEDASIYLTGVM
ncbi:MAG: helix-turn-helix domain-containing protein [Conexivisphaerales archaeon]